MSMSKQQYDPLQPGGQFNFRPSLDSESGPEDDIKFQVRPHNFSRHGNRIWTLAGVAFVLLNISCSLGYTIWLKVQYSHGPQHRFSPVRDAISYTSYAFDTTAIYLHGGLLNTHKPTNFSGYPRPSFDAAWHGLTSHQNIRLQKHELGQFSSDDSLVELSDGSGYFATLTVFQGLHCVERLHHWLYKDLYYNDLTTEEERRLKQHTKHCVDWLRQYVQ